MSHLPLLFGLLLFIGVHALPAFAPARRQAVITQIGAARWKGLFSLISALGLVLMVWGYGQARLDSPWLWQPLAALRHPLLLVVVISLVLIAAAYVPRNRIKQRLGHPMLLGTKLWAFAHLLLNGTLADLLLFGSLLIWASAGFAKARRRDRHAGVVQPSGTLLGDVIAVVVGLAVAMALVMGLHQMLIGVRPY